MAPGQFLFTRTDIAPCPQTSKQLTLGHCEKSSVEIILGLKPAELFHMTESYFSKF